MRRLSAFAGPAILFVIVTGAFWKLLTKQYTWMDQPDMAYQVLPWFQFQAAAWHHGEFPLWDPHVWAGQPLIGQLQPGAAYPLNWPLFLLPLHNGHINQLWLNFAFILTHFLAALFCYWLCLYLGRSRAASVLGGAAFALSGVVGSVGWPQMLNGAIWIPLVFLFLLRATRGERALTNAALAGTFLGISFLSGHHQIPTFTALMVAGVWIFEFWRQRLRPIKPAAVSVLFTALVSAFQMLPAYEYGARSIRWVGSQNAVFWGQSVPYLVHQQPAHSLGPLGVLGFLLPNLSPHDTFVGLAIVVLAAVGFAACFEASEVRLLGAIGAGGLLFALGGFSIFHGLAYLVVPMVEKARSPAMAIVIVQFALVVLAAYGLDALRRGLIGRWCIPVLVTVGILPWPVLAIVASLRRETSLEYERLAVLGLVALALAALLYGWKARRISEAATIGLIFVVVLFELGTVIGGNYRHRETPGGFLAELEKNSDVLEFLRKQPDLVRVEVDTDAVPYNIGDWEGIDQFRAYLGGMTWNVARFEMDRLKGGRLAPELFALNYFLGRQPLRSDQQEVFQGRSGFKVYRNPDAFSHFWTVHESVSVKDAELMSRLQNADLRRQVSLTGNAPALEKCTASDEVRLVERHDTQMVLDVRMACKGMLIASETFYPGWVAAIDGRPAPIFEAYGALRGVVVEAGAHRIEFHYRPMSVYWGAFLTALGLAGALVLALLSGRTAR
ncbi:MAG TPA: hypothetical protein VK335_33440 [Bryobacteraceae bacterium]|nr:hypothetical protein [Bryobacteraceae bacterium]